MIVKPSGCSRKVWLYQTLKLKPSVMFYGHCYDALGVLLLLSFLSLVRCVLAQLLKSRHAAKLLAVATQHVFTASFHPIYHEHMKQEKGKFMSFSHHDGCLLRQ